MAKIHIKIIPYIYILSAILCLALSACSGRNDRKYNILVIHSDYAGYRPYERFNRSFAKAIDDEDVPAQVSYFYLDCDRYNEVDEIARLDSVVNSYVGTGKKIDLIVVNGDQATYSLLSTHNPLLKKLPIVFGAVRYPNWKLLGEYTPYHNVTGLYDSIDVVGNMKFIHKISGCTRVLTQIDDSFLDRKTLAFVDSQLSKHPEVINNMHWAYPLNKIRGKEIGDTLSITSISLRHSERMASESEVAWRRRDANLGSYGDIGDRKMIGSQNYFFMMSKDCAGFRYLILKNETGSRTMVGLYSKQLFTAIDENFDMEDAAKVLGGYFTTWQTTAIDEARIVHRILIGGKRASDIPITVPRKEYVIDWNAHTDVYDANFFRSLPPNVRIVNMPFKERHPVQYGFLVYGFILILIGLIVYSRIMLRREHAAKRMAYDKLKEEQENMKLAVLGSKTYAWIIEDGKANISDDFFIDMNLSKKTWNVGTHHSFWFVMPQYRKGFQHFIEEQKSPGQHTFQFESDFGIGKRIWWEVRSTTIISGKTKKIMGLMIDISDIKKYEQELDAARKKAIEGERLAEEARKLSHEAEMKQSFLANMSHEIRTPLNAIVGFSSLIVDEGDSLSNEDRNSFIKEISHNTNLLLRLINDVLDIARIESGKMEFSVKKVAVKSIVMNTYNATRLQMPKNLEYVLKKGPDGLLINVDDGRMQQVLSNFVTNAGKFTTEGSVTLGWEYDEESKEVEMFVEDTGVGLTPAEQKLVFDRFYKADRFMQGTGLGLSISKLIVDRLGGRIKLRSEKGKGSRFSVVFRVCDKEDEQ